MRRLTRFIAGSLAVLFAPLAAQAEEVRFYEQDGVTYREVRRVVNRPVVETRIEDRTQTVYREKVEVQMCDQTRTCVAPVTEYRWESHWRGRFNPFVQPYLVERFVPRTRWETRTEVVKVPVTRRVLVPTTSTIQRPVTTQRMVPEEVITRTVVAPRRSNDPFAPSATVAGGAPRFLPNNSQAFGGIANLDRDSRANGRPYLPARRGISGGLASRSADADVQWRPAESSARR